MSRPTTLSLLSILLRNNRQKRRTKWNKTFRCEITFYVFLDILFRLFFTHTHNLINAIVVWSWSPRYFRSHVLLTDTGRGVFIVPLSQGTLWCDDPFDDRWLRTEVQKIRPTGVRRKNWTDGDAWILRRKWIARQSCKVMRKNEYLGHHAVSDLQGTKNTQYSRHHIPSDEKNKSITNLLEVVSHCIRWIGQENVFQY